MILGVAESVVVTASRMAWTGSYGCLIAVSRYKDCIMERPIILTFLSRGFSHMRRTMMTCKTCVSDINIPDLESLMALKTFNNCAMTSTKKTTDIGDVEVVTPNYRASALDI